MPAVQEPQRMEFKTELKQLLDLIIHSLYTKKEIFLRELISNAADAIDKVRFESLTNSRSAGRQHRVEDQDHPRRKSRHADGHAITASACAAKRSSKISAPSPAAEPRRFLQSLQAANAQNRPELIGQFGVGFYASFMVADKVTVISRMAGE